MKLLKLSERGHAHIIAPFLAIAAVAVIGGAVLTAINHAQTLPCTYQTVEQPDKAKGNQCVQYAQQMLNSFNAYLRYKNLSNNTTGVGAYLLVSGSSIKTLPSYNATVTTQMSAFQQSINGAAGASAQWKPLAPGANYPLPTDGKLAAKGSTWYALCYVQVKFMTTADRSYGRSDSHGTSAWLEGSYMRVGYSAALDAGCRALLNSSPAPKPTPAPVPNSKLTLTTTKNVSTVAEGSSVTFQGSITNPGPGATTGFTYGPRYFYSNSATQAVPAAGIGYPAEQTVSPDPNKSVSALQKGGSLTGIDETITIPTISATTPKLIAGFSNQKYICGTVVVLYNGASARNQTGAAQCVAIQAPSNATWILTGTTTTATRTAAGVTFTSAITNSGPGTASFAYGPRYFYSTTPNPAIGANSIYAGETVTVANKTTTLGVGATLSGITQLVPVPRDPITPQNTGAKYVCGTVAFSPSNSVGTVNGRSKADCVAVGADGVVVPE